MNLIKMIIEYLKRIFKKKKLIIDKVEKIEEMAVRHYNYVPNWLKYYKTEQDINAQRKRKRRAKNKAARAARKINRR